MRAVLSVPRDELVFRILEPEVAEHTTISLRYAVIGPEGTELETFTEVVTLPGGEVAELSGERAELFAATTRLLALAAATSYFKATIPATVQVPGGLSAAERHFLAEVIRNGLAEFAYRNDVPAALTPRIEAPERPEAAPRGPERDQLRSVLVAVGGGKDSITSIEGVRSVTPAPEITLFSVNSYEPIRDTAAQAGLALVEARRRLDPALFVLNEQGALNGHVPVTAVNSLIGVLTALRQGIDAVVFSNEASSSAGNTFWAGVEVNHQWSKGLGFEALLREHVAGAEVTYFSFLRPLSELAITRQFATLTEYHPVFTSCNRAFHLDEGKRRRWCGDCPKCRFVYLCLSPFVPRQTILDIFTGRDLLADPAQREGFLELFNVGGRLKPFECVGEPDECKVALTLLTRHPEWAGHPFFDLPEVAECLSDDDEIASVFTWDEQNFLPKAFAEVVRSHAD